MSQGLADLSLLEWAIPLLLAIWGGAAGYFSQILAHRRKFSWLDFFLRAVISGFSGVDVFLMTDGVESQLYRGSMVGMAGWLGMESLTIVKNLKRVKILVDND